MNELAFPAVIADALFDAYSAHTYVVGGYLREKLSGGVPHDIDLCTSAVPDQILRLTNIPYKGYIFKTVPVGIAHGTISILVYRDDLLCGEYEVTTLRSDLVCDGRHAEVRFTDNILVDLSRRDFTINAMARRIGTDNSGDVVLSNLIDPFGGKGDLDRKVIRAVGSPNRRFEEDHLRMLRACRFVGYGDGFSIDAATKFAIVRNREKLRYVSKERIREELLKILKLEKPSMCLEAMRRMGLLEDVIPCLKECIGVTQNKYHSETVYEHCIVACDCLPKDRPLLRLVGLLHDVGKPGTKEGDGDDCRFLQHESVGAQIVEDYLREYKFSNDEIEYVTLMVACHMYHMDFDTKKSTIKRWLRKVGDCWRDLIQLRMADRAANKAKMQLEKPLVTAYMRDLIEKISEIEAHQEPMKVTDLAISGRTLIGMGYEPGPKFGKTLRMLMEKVLEDPALNQEEILTPMAKECMESL